MRWHTRDGRVVDSNRLSIAPMMEVTDRHFRYMMRLLSRRCKLYTEMIVDETLLHNLEPKALEYYLGHSEIEAPLAVQLGGNDPERLGRAAARLPRLRFHRIARRKLEHGAVFGRIFGRRSIFARF